MIDLASPFYALYETLWKSWETSPTFEVSFDERAEKMMRKLGPEFQRRAKKVISGVHGQPVAAPNPYLTRMNENQHTQTGLDWQRREGYTLGDYRVRMIGRLDGHRMTILHVGTREDSKHTGRSAR
jgi:mRNA-degrading endonuclease RelE of RelBE toxin-antitoxin system